MILLSFVIYGYGTILFGQNCAEFDIAPTDHGYESFTSEYTSFLMKDVGEDATSLPSFFIDLAGCWLSNVENTPEIKKFSIRDEDKSNHPELVYLIMNSRSLASDEEKQNWFNLMPMMNNEQLDKLYDILERETIKINAIELKYEEKRKLIAAKYSGVEENDEKDEKNENSLRQSEFRFFGYDKETVNEKVTTYNFDFVLVDGDDYVGENGDRYGKKDFYLIHPKDFYGLRKNITKEQWRTTKWFNEYLDFCYNYLKPFASNSTMVLQDEATQEWLYGYWSILLEEYRNSLDMSSRLEEMASIPMENLIGKRHSKKEIKMFRYQYLQMVYTNRGDYGAAARCCAERIENEQGTTPQHFVFNLYLPIIAYQDAEWKRDGGILEDMFVQWYGRIDPDDFYKRIPDDNTQTTIMVADYYLAFGQNSELKTIVSTIKDHLIMGYANGNLHYGKDVDGRWYGFLNCAYLDGAFADGAMRYEDLESQISQAGFEVTDAIMVEYACYYCLYQIINNPQSKGNLSGILRKIITTCNNPQSGAFNYIEKDIAKDLLIRDRDSQVDKYRAPFVKWISPRTGLVQTDEDSVRLTIVVGNGSMPMVEAKVYTENEVYGKEDFDKDNKMTWSFDKNVKLDKGKNNFIIVYKDASQNEYDDTLRVVYKPNDYTVRKDIALLFAVDEYDVKKGYKPFKTDGQQPIQDAEKFSRMLDEFGFETHMYKNPTAEQIDDVLRQYAKRNYEKYDQLLIFFSGHGTTDDVTGAGYFVPTDGDKDRKARTMVSYNDIKELFKIRKGENNCRHILIIADACHSGSFIKETKGSAEENAKRIQSEAMEYVSRCFIGSASPDEESNAKSELINAFSKLFDNKKRDYFDFSDLERAVRDEEGNKKEKGRWGDDQSQSSFYFNRKSKER